MADIISVRDVTKAYPGGIMAVDTLSLAVEEGEFVTLLGPSGCGKTTTIRMIAGFEIPTSGRIYLAGEDVTELPPYKRQVNTVFQDYALFPHMTIRENVGYGLRVAGVPRVEIGRRVDETLGTVGLRDKAEARPATLSGGQKQRVALARALVRRPKVLLLDEPLSALDAKLREAMQVELKHLHQKLGITFMFVTHDQTEALVMSDRVVVMDRGRIVQAASPSELYDHPATPYVANFVGASNMIAATVAALSGPSLTIRTGGGEIRCAANGRRFEIGDHVVAAVRPEKVAPRAAEAPPEGHSLIPGRVVDGLFHGNSYRLEVTLDDGAPFLVDIPLKTGASLADMPSPGATIELVVDPDTVSVFPAEREGSR